MSAAAARTATMHLNGLSRDEIMLQVTEKDILQLTIYHLRNMW